MVLTALAILAVGCSDGNRSPQGIRFNSVSLSGQWRIGDRVFDNSTLHIASVSDTRPANLEVTLPRLWDLKFVGWGPELVGENDVLWIYSADIGSLLYLVGGPIGLVRLPCPPDLEPPEGWPGERKIPCSAL